MPYKQIKGISEIRLWGMGGVFSYTGLYSNRKIGKYESYIANFNEAFLITLNTGKKYAISCRNYMDMIIALQNLCDKNTRNI